MTPVTPFLSRYAWALLAGGAVATLCVNLSPGTYYDLIETRIATLPGGFRLTPEGVVSDFLMAGFVFLIGKELWEAMTSEGRPGPAPMAAALGGMIGAAALWLILAALFETANADGAPGWVVPVGGDVVLAFLFGRILFGPGHRALQLLLFLTCAASIVGLLLAATLTLKGGNGLSWLALPAGAALVGWQGLTRPMQRKGASERVRLRARWLAPWIGLALVSWAGVTLAGLPGCLGFLPLLPALPQSRRSFGLFARAEDFLGDPLSRLANRLHQPMVGVMALFGLMQGGIDLSAVSPTTLVALGAMVVGHPLGVLAGGALFGGLARRGLTRGDVWRVAALTGIGFTAPALAMSEALPGGIMQEGARLGLALSVLIGPALLLAARR